MLSISNCIEHTDVIGILLNGVWMFRDERAMNSLRDEEKFRFDLTDGHINTQTIFDQSEFTQQTAAFAIYLTIFVMALLGKKILFKQCDPLHYDKQHRCCIFPLSFTIRLITLIRMYEMV